MQTESDIPAVEDVIFISNVEFIFILLRKSTKIVWLITQR